jgi:two-component system sensor histidine kinase/response regulator
MSHELRTPLNAILGFTGTLLMRLPGPLTAGQERQLQTVQASSKHLLALINDLLDLARLEAGEVNLGLEETLCREVIEEVVATLRPLAEEKALDLAVVMPEEPVVVKADRRALSQILINLLNNAIKFTEQGQVRVELAQRHDNRQALAAIHVLDTGIGIKPEKQAGLFRPFEQALTGRRDGAGMGLYLSHKLAELMGATIECESEYSKGSRFTVLIPQA